ncbi:hypothetical protein J1614_003638 [Plenodomus biglobosus]|nr:hypothetical protein J1614_003638 [Plenodomus biglobosus]
MVFTAGPMALPNAGATGPRLHARHRAAVEEGQDPRATAAPVRTGSALDLPAALHEERAEVTLPADDLRAPLLEIGASGQADRDVAQGQRGDRAFLRLTC